MSTMEVTMMALQKEREYLIGRAEKEARIAQALREHPAGVPVATRTGRLQRRWRAMSDALFGRPQRPLLRRRECEPHATAAD